MKTKKRTLSTIILALILSLSPQMCLAKSTVIGPGNTQQYQYQGTLYQTTQYQQKQISKSKSNFFEEYQVLAYLPLIALAVPLLILNEMTKIQ